MSKKRCPWIFRNKVSCGDCGYIYKEQDYYYRTGAYFDCPKCGIRLSTEEFWEENYFKWSREAVLDE